MILAIFLLLIIPVILLATKPVSFYVLDNTDSGWDMAHQSPHHYANALDWKNFKLSKSVWVGEKMFETYTTEQPQWVYPPVGHLGNGPSGVAWLTENLCLKICEMGFW